MKALLEKIRKILRSRRTRQLLTRAVSGVAAIVVFITTYALVLPAITMEQDALCGIPEHQHTDACYEERLVCGIPEGEEHHHDASCYEKFLICGKEVHTHSTECYQKDSNAVVSTGSGAAASTALEVFAEPDVYETGDSEFASGAAVMDNAAGGQSVMEEPADEEAASAQDAAEGTEEVAEGTDEVDLVSEGVASEAEGLNAEGTDVGEDAPEKASENDVPETVPDGSDNVSNELENTEDIEDTEQEGPAGAGDYDLAADSSQDAAGTALENSGNGSSENIDADTTNPEDTENKDSEEDKTAVDIFGDADSGMTEQVNNEDEDLGLEADDPLDTNEDSVSGFDTLDNLDTLDTSNRAAEDTDGAETEDTASAAGTEEAANDATTNVLPEPVETEKLSSGFVPELDSIEFVTVLNKHTDFFYFHPEEGQELPASSAEVMDWKKVKNGFFGSTKLESTDLVKMYLSYTIPAGALNETNQVARYRLPSNIHLTDDQIIAINATENGVSALYADAVAKEDESMVDEGDESIAEDAGDEAYAEGSESDSKVDDSAEDAGTASGTDEEDGNDIEAASDTSESTQDENAANYQKYLGAEAIEGTRTPDEKLKEGAQEYISAIVKAENVFDDEGLYGEKGAFLGQDLIFIFTPYSIEKNQTIYNTDGEPVSAGEKITGWFACDFNMSQIDWVEEDTDLDNSTVEKTAEVVFVEKDSEKNVKEISRILKLVDVTEGQSDAANGGETAAAAETAAVAETAAAAETAAVAETAAAAEIAATAATASETTATDETALATTGNTSEQAAPEEPEDGPFKSGTMTADGDGYRITLDYTEEAKIPANAELSVREITAETDKEAYEACLEQAGQQVAADDKTSVDQKASRFFDIEIHVKDTDSEGKEETRKIEPSAPVSVNIQIIDDSANSEDAISTDKETNQSEPAVLHFAEEGVEQIDSTVKTSEELDDNMDRSGSEKTEPGTEISFEAESFSIYGVVYTVDFHYEINGKVYNFSIPGGGFVSLEHMVEVLSIGASEINSGNEVIESKTTDESVVWNAESADDVQIAEAGFVESTVYGEAIKLNEVDVSETTRKLVADVVSVEFSSPELVWTGKVNEEYTVGGLKETNGLESEYSANLTEKEIAEINAQTVEAGDWALISLQPFNSEETLTVTMKNGDLFAVKVTDAQISKHVITDDGEDYIITVTYDESAGIPSEADLNVIEIKPGTSDYETYLIQAEEALSRSVSPDGEISEFLSNRNTFARFFDINIVVDGKEIEPKTTVQVDVAYTGSANVPQGIIDVVHFADSGIEVIDATRRTEDDGTIVSFKQDSFSVTGTIIDYSNLDDGDYYILYNNRGRWYALTSSGTPKEVTQYYDNVSGSIVNYNGEENITWTFAKVNDTDSDYVIKAKGENVYVSLQYAPTGNDYYHGNVVTGTSEAITIRDDPNSYDPQVVNILNNTTQSYTYYVIGNPRTVTANRTYRLGWTSYGLEYGQGGLIFKPDEIMYTTNRYGTYMGRQTPAGVNLARVSEDSSLIHGNFPNMTYNEEQLNQWLNKAMNEDPIQGISKKASVYDYDNRIYEINFTARSGVLAMSQDLSMAFVTDVSNSMLFPASLDPVDTSSGTTLSNVKLNYTNLNKLPHSDGEVYFTIGDKNGTSTVYALWYGPGKDGRNSTSWHAMDASYFARWKANKTEGVNFTDRDYVLSNTADNIAIHKNDSQNSSNNSTQPKDNLRYTIYTANDEFFNGLENEQITDMSNGQDLSSLIQYNDDGTVTINSFNMGNRLYYLESSIASSVKDMQTIAANYPLGSVYVALETFAKTVQKTYDYKKIGGLADDMDAANALYDNNYKDIFDALSDIKGADGTNQYGALSNTTMFGSYSNGSFSGGYINNSSTNQNIAASKKYVVLITDGAPNAENANHNKPSEIQKVAERLKANGINVITIGLSIEDVEIAPEILWWSASGVNNTDPNPKTYTSNYQPSSSDESRLFYWAKSGQDLTYILREIVRTVMKEAAVNATVTDKIEKLFYPVDRDGVPLKNGDWIKSDGTKWKNSDPVSDKLGQISCDASGQYSVTWKDQDMDWDNWNGTIFVKSKEDFLGGNTMATNTEAKIYPTSYAINKGQPTELKRTYNVDEQIELTTYMPTPYVNVDNLKMNGNSTDFTVHVGTEVDPEAELIRLWNEIKINEVIKPNGADDNYEMTDENQVFYSFDRSQDKVTSDLLWEGGNPYGTIPLNHYVSIDVLNNLLSEVKGGATTKTATSGPIVYAPYGDTNTSGYLTVTLKKTLSSYADDGTKNTAPDAHEADNTWLTLNIEGDLTETYEITIEYTPYTPVERKVALEITDTSNAYMNNGDNGPGFEVDPTNSQRSDNISSYNRHRVYVYARGLKITKTNIDFVSVLKGAKFELYRLATEDDPAEGKRELSGLTGDFVKVADLDTSTNGVAEINPTDYPHAIRAQSRTGATYYLVETEAPDGYIMLPSPIEVALNFSDIYTPKPGSVPQQIQPAIGLYDWDQEAVLTLASGPNVKLCDVNGVPISEGSQELYYYTLPNADTDVMCYSISNNPGVELPATGGVGTSLIYLFGSMITGFAGAGLVMRKRKRVA